MKITTKGNSSWLFLTTRGGTSIAIRTRDINAVEKNKPSTIPGAMVFYGEGTAVQVQESYTDILETLGVKFPAPDIELQADSNTQGS
jgi:hypothetical protein